MNLSKSNKKYVSETDLYLQDFNTTHPKTLSQFAEKTKHQPVFEKRDNSQKSQSSEDTELKNTELWEGF